MWSKLINTTVGDHAKHLMDSNAHQYHNWDHIESMFLFLKLYQQPYDINLDAAILFHDIVYDDRPEKELRSYFKFIEMKSQYPDLYRNLDHQVIHNLIMATCNHEITESTVGLERAIIRADLHGLSVGGPAFKNYVNIMSESQDIYDISIFEFATANLGFMSGLWDTILTNSEFDTVSDKNLRFWMDVGLGIKECISYSQGILRGHDK
jgi:hypothetical protein